MWAFVVSSICAQPGVVSCDDIDTLAILPKINSMTDKNKKSSGGRSITKELYDKMVDAFREHGEDFSKVSKTAGVNWRTARKAWETGWSHMPSRPWATAIRDTITREQVEARAALEREKKDLVADHRIARQKKLRDAIENSYDDLIDARAKQGRIVRASRDNSMAALAISQRLLKGALPLADQVTQQLSAIKGEYTLSDKLRLLRQVGRFAADAVEIAQKTDEMERKALGEPDSIVHVAHSAMTYDDAKSTLSEISDLISRYSDGEDADEIIDITPLEE